MNDEYIVEYLLKTNEAQIKRLKKAIEYHIRITRELISYREGLRYLEKRKKELRE